MNQVGSVREFFERVAARGNEPQLSHLIGVWEFDVEDTGRWTITVDRGSLSVAEGTSSREPGSQPTVRIHLDEADLLRIVRGEGHANLITEALRGELTVEGELSFALKLHALMPLEEPS